MQEITSIFLIDDREIDLFIASKVIQLAGLPVELTTSSSVSEALKLLENFYTVRKKYPEIIVTDFFMPLVDGVELISDIKKLKNFSENDTRIWVLTAGIVGKDILRLWQVGIDEIIIKPLERERLLALFNEVKEFTPRHLSGIH